MKKQAFECDTATKVNEKIIWIIIIMAYESLKEYLSIRQDHTTLKHPNIKQNEPTSVINQSSLKI